ncbi:MAG: hypothetical protein JSV79_09640 [Armatimonadota bacterium]|nr:MAG: hypothetical protein JSV79_09640 [Armatimonadota bacterium]
METHVIEISLPDTPPKAGARRLSKALHEADRALSGKTRFQVRRRKLRTRAVGVQPDVLVMTIAAGVQLVTALVSLRTAMRSVQQSHPVPSTPREIEVASSDRVVRIPFDASQSEIEVGLGGLQPEDVIRIAFKTA